MVGRKCAPMMERKCSSWCELGSDVNDSEWWEGGRMRVAQELGPIGCRHGLRRSDNHGKTGRRWGGNGGRKKRRASSLGCLDCGKDERDRWPATGNGDLKRERASEEHGKDGGHGGEVEMMAGCQLVGVAEGGDDGDGKEERRWEEGGSWWLGLLVLRWWRHAIAMENWVVHGNGEDEEGSGDGGTSVGDNGASSGHGGCMGAAA